MGNSKIGDLAMQTGAQVANTALGAVTGAILARSQDRRQIRQQKKLQDLQIQGNKEMTDYQYQKQLQMWKDTNYSAQMEQLEQAGLNPGLIYGMSGGGATTTGSGGGNVSGGTAASHSGEIQGMIELGLQRQMQAAQIKLMESQAKKTDVEAENISGVERENIAMSTKSLAQGIENQKAQKTLTEADTYLKQLQGTFEGATMEDRIDQVQWNAEQALELVRQARNQTYIQNQTLKDQIKQIHEEAIGAALRNELTKAQTKQTGAQTEKTLSDIKVNEAQIKTWASQIAQKAIELEQNNIKLDQNTIDLELKKIGLENTIETPGIGGAISRLLTNLMDHTKGILRR